MVDHPLTATVIVPAYNAERTIGDCLRALQQQTIPPDVSYDILIADDASTDRTAAIARQLGVRVISMTSNQGQASARNAAAAEAQGDILLFTDADCQPLSNWIAAMVRPFRDDAQVVGVKGAYKGHQDNLVARFTQLEFAEKYEQLARHPQISFIDTYSAAYRRDIFLTTGGFDSQLRLLEDQDFSFRLAAQGHKLVFTPQARVYHQHLTSPWTYYRRKVTFGRWKTVILRRHPERISNDSRTPQTLRLQFLLALALLPLLPLALFWRPARRLSTLLLSGFSLSALPFLHKTLQHDAAVLPIVLPMLLLRALALAHGTLDGMLRLRRLR